MTIEEWLEVQKKDGNVSLPLYIDENGNQCMQTNAYATRYGNSNVETELNKLRASELNDYGVIQHTDTLDALALPKKTGVYYGSWTNVPETGGYIYATFVSEYVGRLVYICANTGNIYKNDYINKQYKGWVSLTEQHAFPTYMNGWVPNGTDSLFTKIGDVVWFNGVFRHGTNTVDTVIAKIPTGYLPAATNVIIAGTVKGNGIILVTTDGDIKIGSVLPDINNVHLHAMWRIR